MSRHNLLVANVAHVDTPGYVPQDLQRPSMASSDFGVTMDRCHASHLMADAGSPNGRVFEDRSAGTGLDGNYVSLDAEAAKIAANQSRYDVVATLMSAQYKQLAYAANDGAGA